MGWKAAEKLIRHWKILRGDNVMIIRGKDKGESGLIKRVIRSQNRVIVEGKNLVKKHIKQGEGHTGGIFSIEAPLHVSNVQVLDPVTGLLVKGKFIHTTLATGNHVRLDTSIWKMELKSAGPKDTRIEHVLEKTYDAKAGIGMPDL
ncbi:Os12g0135900 [Oryza sativa Japonica Group]|uniref:Os12g0135900 protein n=1 Tax=Oryza sativa subsp. japonica TaxID=39947 RepID=Q0IQ96_ORYSJ|nr:Os12g0135900 [Oryza sativa Japonica Group]|eukprot:NP_001066100.2 Os12g0135900 [Oryza sativa Japonica Group]